MKFCYNTNSTLPKQCHDLDPSYKTDLELLDCFGRKKAPSYNRRNTVVEGYLPVISHSKVGSKFFP